MIHGARQGSLSGIRHFFARAMARDLNVFVLPGLDISRAHGIDVEAAGCCVVSSPRHASVLLIVGDVSPAICEAASIIYAQMVRPRVLFSVGAGSKDELSPLPLVDVAVGLSQQDLIDGVQQVRMVFENSAFQIDVKDFDAPALHVRTEYVCPMHAEVVQDEPGSCPRCGMFLVARETQESAAKTDNRHNEEDNSMKNSEMSSHDQHVHGETAKEYFCPMHPEVVQAEPGSCPKCGMFLEAREKTTEARTTHTAHAGHEVAKEYFCSMHPEVVQDEPGSCPKCGMFLEEREKTTEARTTHTAHAGHETAKEYFCSMHPEVVQAEPGSCPKCGMFLEEREKTTEAKTTHTAHAGHETAKEYFCSMHPEVVQAEPGSCPKCGMFLEEREKTTEARTTHTAHAGHDTAKEYFCSMHPEVVQGEPGSCPKCGMFLEPREKIAEAKTTHAAHAGHETETEYVCPMHPEVVQNKPGDCPKCGMHLEPREKQGSSTHDHKAMDQDNNANHNNHDEMNHDENGFMSMVDVTKDLPRSSDDLKMEWIDAPFGPFFPGLPSGLQLTFSLDGDTVAGSGSSSLTDNIPLLKTIPMHGGCFVKHFLSLDPLTPVSSQLLICQAMENAAGIRVDANTEKARIGALERERVASHLNWLVLFAQQTGFSWLARKAGFLQLKFLNADINNIIALKLDVQKLINRIQKTPLLKPRTSGIGQLPANDDLCGVVARASGVENDVRSDNDIYADLGFKSLNRNESDAWARMQIRLAEMLQSLQLIEAVGIIEIPTMIELDEISGTGKSQIETPRGKASLEVVLEKGFVTSATLETPSAYHIQLIETLTSQQELGDALIAVGSLDLSPWSSHQ
ncbi:MAG: hypothetical protein L3J89_12170 [Gammaproteobacteria bacterium]|nr:hypothetical protein [Gammaproteobacteria bacterium]